MRAAPLPGTRHRRTQGQNHLFGDRYLKNRLIAIGETRLRQVSLAVQQHPRRLAAMVGAALRVAGSGAFAVASLAPDVSEIPVRQVLEAIEPLTATQPQAVQDTLDAHRFRLFRTEAIRSSDTASSLLQRLGVADTAAAAFLRTDANARQAFSRTGRTVFAETSNDNQLLKLTVRWAQDGSPLFQRLVVEQTATGLRSRIELAPLASSSRLASATVRTSLFAATDAADIPDAVATQLAEIFANNIDFRRALRRGDRLSMVYETLEADGEPMRTGRVLSAEVVSGGKTHQAIWFQELGKRGSYYALDGSSLGRAFLTSPVEFSRVSSGFSMRMHPILQRWRAHLGTDFAAPTGTAVHSVGDGKVEFAGVQNGFGNVVFVDHGNNKVTVYAHLSQINVNPGQNVSQGQNIGAVGSTGWATGPHLHFEFRVNGVHQDPEDTALLGNETAPIAAASRPAFDRLASTMRMQLSAAALVQQASAE